MANPVAQSIRVRGGVVDRGAAVTSLILQEGGVCGVRIGSEEIRSAHVILAAHWAPAKKLLNDAFGPQKWNERMLTLPTMPAATLQMDLEARPSTA